ncbi:MAG: hypothetical protein AAF566_08320 [Pseudomonadota bacterium]
MIANGQGPNLDSISVTGALSVTSIKGGSLTLRAEDAIGTGGRVSDIHDGADGEAFFDYTSRTDASLEWRVDSRTASEAELLFRYALGANAPRTMAVEINGVVFERVFTFDPTGSWTNWQTASLRTDLA